MSLRSKLSAAALALGLALGASPAAAQQKPKTEAPPPLPPASARLWVIAPAPQGLWTMRIDNEGTLPLRIAADARLLRFEMAVPPPEGKRKQKPTIVKCKGPGAIAPDGFPEDRTLVLAPGESYVETFDPRLFCFGNDAKALAGGTLVRAKLGWDPGPTWSKKAPKAPFIAEHLEETATFAPVKELLAPAMLLSFGEVKPAANEGEASEPKAASEAPPTKDPAATGEAANKAAPAAPPPDPLAADFELEAATLSDAYSMRTATITVTAKNVGKRKTYAAFRGRMLTFSITGPDGTVQCGDPTPDHAVPRDNFRNVSPQGSVSLSVLVGEVCVKDALNRAGLYYITPTLHALENGEPYAIKAWTGDITAPKPTLLRLQTADRPYHLSPPKATSTASLAPKGEN